MRRSVKARPKARSTERTSITIEASPDLSFEVTPAGRFGMHVLLLESLAGKVSLQQSMNFGSESAFMDWHENEHRRHAFPCAYSRLRMHVLSLLGRRDAA